MNNKVEPFSLEDIHTFLTSTSIDVPNIVIHIDTLAESNYNLEALYKNNFSLILFIPDSVSEVGHFVLLSHISDNTLEYFDSFGRVPPESVLQLAKQNNMRLIHNKIQLQDKISNTCAKWCIARLFSLPNSLKSFIELYSGHKTLSPDVLVNNIFVLKR